MNTHEAPSEQPSTPFETPPLGANSTPLPGQSRWRFVQNLVASYSFYFSGYLLSFLAVPYLARILGPSHWGVFALTQTFAMYLILVVDCGFALSATKLVARSRDEPEILSRVLAGVWSAKALLALFSVAVALGATRVVPAFRDHPLLFWSGVSWGVLQGASMNWYYQGLERMRTAATVDISVKALAILAMILVVRAPEDAWRALALNATACLISLLVLSMLAYREAPFRWPTWDDALTNLRTGLHAFMPRNSFIVSSLSGVFVLGFFAPPAVLGYYAGAERISRAVIGLLAPLTDALYARINRIMASSPQSFFPVARRLLMVMGGCGTMMGVAVFLCAPWMVRIFLGRQFGPAVLIVRIFALQAPLIALGNTLGAHWMLSLGLDRPFGYISLVSALFTVALSVILAPHFGAPAVAAVVVASQLLIALATFVAVRRHCRNSLPQNCPRPDGLPPSEPRTEIRSAEWQMLFAVARLRLDAATHDRIERLARSPLDWDRLLETAREHALLPLLHRHLKAVCPQGPPPELMNRIAVEVFAGAARNLFMTAELARVVTILEQGGVPVIPFKGPVLANMVHRDISLRSFSDLDILVRPADLKRAREALTAGGYQAEFNEDAEENKYIHNAEKVIRFIRNPGFIVIEMHWEFAPRNLGFPDLATPQLWARSREESVGGKLMTVLSPEDVFLQLCFHGAKHCWDKLEWICSLSELIRSHEKMDWAWIHRYARDCASERILHLGLALARKCLGSLPPQVGLQKLNPVSERLADVVLQNMMSRSRQQTRKAPYRYWFYLLAKDRLQDRIRMLFLASGQTLRPRQLRRAYRTPRLGRMLVDDNQPQSHGVP